MSFANFSPSMEVPPPLLSRKCHPLWLIMHPMDVTRLYPSSHRCYPLWLVILYDLLPPLHTHRWSPSDWFPPWMFLPPPSDLLPLPWMFPPSPCGGCDRGSKVAYLGIFEPNLFSLFFSWVGRMKFNLIATQQWEVSLLQCEPLK